MDLKSLSKKQVTSLIVFLILLIAIPFTAYLAQKTQIFKPKAMETTTAPTTSIDDLTNQLLRLNAQVAQATQSARLEAARDDDSLDSMIVIATERKEKLLEEIENNPQAFLDHATLSNERNSFSEEIKPYIEKNVEAEGELTVIDVHFHNEDSKLLYELKTGELRLNLHFVQDPPDLLTGTVIRASGISLDSEVVTGSATPFTGRFGGIEIIRSFPLLLPLNITGQRRIAVLLINPDAAKTPGMSEEQIRQLLFTGDNSVNNFYRASSFDQVSLTGDVFGWFEPAVPDELVCKKNAWSNAADTEAQREGVDLSSYNHIIYIFASSEGCEFPPGIGTIGGRPGRSWIFDINSKIVYGHELGHNLGLDHSGILECNRFNANYLTGNCQFSEYGEDTVMGYALPDSFLPRHFNAPHKIALGWIPLSSIQTVSRSGEYTISPPVQISAGGLRQVLKIRKLDTNEYYYVSYRQPVGFDSRPPFLRGVLLEPEPFAGVVIHTFGDNPAQPTKRVGYALHDNIGFYDRANSLLIKQLAHDNNSVRLRVEFDYTGGIFSDLSAVMTQTSAEFSFSFNDISQSFEVDISTDPNMVNNVFVEFARGGNSPIVNANLPAWSEYSCGRTLYWRIYTVDTSAQSPIMQSNVECRPSSLTPTPSTSPPPVTPSRRIIYMDFNGVSIYPDASGQFNIPDVTLPGTENTPQLFLIPLYLHYSDGTNRYIPFSFNYLNALESLNLPSPSPSPSPVPFVEPIGNCRLTVNSSSTAAVTVNAGTTSFELTNIPDTAIRAQWNGSNPPVVNIPLPSGIEDFGSRSNTARYFVTIGPYLSDKIGTYTRYITVYGEDDNIVCRTNTVTVNVNPAGGGPRGPIYPTPTTGGSNCAQSGQACGGTRTCCDSRYECSAGGTCTLRQLLPNNASCRSNPDCQSNFCDLSVFICKPPPSGASNCIARGNYCGVTNYGQCCSGSTCKGPQNDPYCR